MRILVEILHPAHVHVFRNAIQVWRERGDEVLVLSRDKDCTLELLELYGIPHTCLSRLRGKKVHLLFEMLQRDLRMWRAARAFKPDVLTGVMGVTIAQVGRLIGKPAVVFYDTENAGLTNRFVYPLARAVCTPDCYQGPVNGCHLTYPSYHELAYLHPRRFTPDPAILRSAGLEPGEPFYLVRFVSWQASHDIGERGFSLELKRELVRQLSQHGRVLISSEGPLPRDLEQMRFRLPAHQMHHVLAYAHLLVGESATMASEAAVLGVPALFISDTGRGYTDDQEVRYGLVRNFKTTDADRALALVKDLLADPELRTSCQAKRRQLLEEKIDTTDWMVATLDRIASGLDPQG